MTAMVAKPAAAGSSGKVPITTHVAAASEPIISNAVVDEASATRTGGGQDMAE